MGSLGLPAWGGGRAPPVVSLTCSRGKLLGGGRGEGAAIAPRLPTSSPPPPPGYPKPCHCLHKPSGPSSIIGRPFSGAGVTVLPFCPPGRQLQGEAVPCPSLIIHIRAHPDFTPSDAQQLTDKLTARPPCFQPWRGRPSVSAPWALLELLNSSSA